MIIIYIYHIYFDLPDTWELIICTNLSQVINHMQILFIYQVHESYLYTVYTFFLPGIKQLITSISFIFFIFTPST